MANGWSAERRARQAAHIRDWKPWEKSTGPRTDDGKARVSRNAFKGGMRPRMRELMRDVRWVLLEQELIVRALKR